MTYDFQSINCYAENVCGDSFLCEHNGDDLLFVHSDGMGHGAKANVLSELACEIVMSEWQGVNSLPQIIETLSRRLPVSELHGAGYSTFTLVDYDKKQNSVTMVEYENPTALFFHTGKLYELSLEHHNVTKQTDNHRKVRLSQFKPEKSDRLVIVSDGVTQSGLGNESMSFGWGAQALGEFVTNILASRNDISCTDLCDRVLNQALSNEAYYPNDDMSMFTITF